MKRNVIIFFLIILCIIIKSQTPIDAVLVSYMDTKDALNHLTSKGYKYIHYSEDDYVSMVYETEIKDTSVMIVFPNNKTNGKIGYSQMVFHGRWSESNLNDFIVKVMKNKELGEETISDKIKCKLYGSSIGFFCVYKDVEEGDINIFFKVK